MNFHPPISSSLGFVGLAFGVWSFFFAILVSVALLKEISWHWTKNTVGGGRVCLTSK